MSQKIDELCQERDQILFRERELIQKLKDKAILLRDQMLINQELKDKWLKEKELREQLEQYKIQQDQRIKDLQLEFKQRMSYKEM